MHNNKQIDMAIKHIKLNKHVCKHKEINMPIKHKTHQILFPFLQNKTICINKNSFSPFMYKSRKTCIYTKILLPFLSIINKGIKVKTKQCSPSLCQQRGEIKSTNKEIYAIYIHEEEDAKLTSLHTCITWRRDEKP